MSTDSITFAKQAFAHVYDENPAEFNKVAKEAIHARVREKIKEMRGELQDKMAADFLKKDTEEPIVAVEPVAAPAAIVEEPKE